MKRLFFSTFVYCRLLCLFLFLGNEETIYAQTPVLSSDYFTRFCHLTTKDGLSANKVLDILQDKYGIMWFATVNGLAKYDGFRFSTYYYSEDDSHSLSCNEVTSLAEDMEGNLWIGTGSGLNRYDRAEDAFVRYTAGEQAGDSKNALRSNYVKALHADSTGCLWVETADGFLSRFDWDTEEWKHFKHFSDRHEGDYCYWHIFEDSGHDLWVGGRMMSAFHFSREKLTFEEIPVWSKGGALLEGACFVETADKQLLSPNEGFLASYNPEKRQFEYRNSLPLHSTCALLDEDGNIWIGGNGGVIRLQGDLKTGTVFRHMVQDECSLLSDKVNCLYKDPDGIIWIGTDEGVSFYSKNLNAFRHYRSFARPPYSLSSGKIRALMQDRDGLLWIGTEDHGVDTLSFPAERTGNLTYSLLTKDLDEKTFDREKDVMEQYARHEVIVAPAPFQPGGFQYQAFRKSGINYNLNENSVSALYQDKRGIIYIGLWSHVGFNTYDKRTATFKRYALWSKKPDWRYPMLFEGNPFGSNWYNGFLEDSRSRFWCVTWEGFGLNLFDRATGEFDGKHYMPISAPCLPRGGVTMLALDTCTRRMYMSGGRNYYGYYNFDSKSFKRYGEVLPPDYPNRDIICRYYQNYDAELLSLPLYFSFYNMLYDGQGHIWLADRQQILKHSLAAGRVESAYKSGVEGEFAWCVSKDRQFVIVGQKDALFLLSIQNRRTTQFLTFINKGFKGESISALYDDGRYLWVGTDRELWRYHWKTRGLDKIPVFPLRRASLNISVLTGGDDGAIYAGCAYGVVHLKDGKVVREYRFGDKETELPGNRVKGLYLENRSKLWIATNDGLVLWEENAKNSPVVFRHDEKDPCSLPDNIVHSMLMGPDSALWVATEKGIGVYHPQTGRFEDKSLPDRTCLTSRLGSCIMEDHLGNIWLGTTEKGLNVLHTPEDTIAHYTCRTWDRNGLTNNCVNCLLEDSQYQIWVGTDRGLCRYRTATDDFESIDGIRERQVQSIQEDSGGHLWISTDKGLYCLSGSGHIERSFYDFHGLQGNSFNTGASCRLQDGRLAFGGNNGFNLFRPKELLRKVIAKPVVFSDFKVHDSVRYADVNGIGQIHLSYKDNSFSVGFTAADYEFNRHLSYRYRLQPFDKDWIDTEFPFQIAKYTNLSPGDYRFEVEASNPYGEWTGMSHVLLISVATPWYLQWWFFCLVAITLSMSVMAMVRYRERKLQARAVYLEKVVKERTEDLKRVVDTKDKFFAIISHDLRGPCRELERMSGHLSVQTGLVEKEDTERNISLLQHTARHVNELLNKLLDWARSQEKRIEPSFRQANLLKEVENTLKLLRPAADKKEIHLLNRIVSDVMVYTDTDMLATILRNLISNAIKYSYRNSEIVIQAEDGKAFVEVSVTDHGTGMTGERLQKLFRIDSKLRVRGTEREQGTGLGLLVVHEFISQLGETIRVESEPDRGTVFTFTLRKNQNEDGEH